ncbi:siderophore-interacting protein [Streptomyces sp. NPDC087866]|uniref:siderophore-interacting protein n=1 Tax=unclassified Streptomyces TaxID=2593676 RepID=UPI0033A19FBD
MLPVQGEAKLIGPRDPRPLSRAYAVRRWGAEAGELDVDFVSHGVGVGTAWVRPARPGDRIHLSGPSAPKGLPVGADWWLVAGDDTVLPAIGRLLDELPPARPQVFTEIAEEVDRQAKPFERSVVDLFLWCHSLGGMMGIFFRSRVLHFHGLASCVFC